MNVCLNLCLATGNDVLASILAPFEEKLGLFPSIQLLLPRVLLLLTRILSVRIDRFLVIFAISSIGTITLGADLDLVCDALGVLHVQITASSTLPDGMRHLDHAMVPTGRTLRLVPVACLQCTHTVRYIFVQNVVVRSHIVCAALVLVLLEALMGRRWSLFAGTSAPPSRHLLHKLRLPGGVLILPSCMVILIVQGA